MSNHENAFSDFRSSSKSAEACGWWHYTSCTLFPFLYLSLFIKGTGLWHRVTVIYLISNLYLSLNSQHNFMYMVPLCCYRSSAHHSFPLQQPVKTDAQCSQKRTSHRRFSYYSFITDFYGIFLKTNLKYISCKLGFEFHWPGNNCCLFPFWYILHFYSSVECQKFFGICLKLILPLETCNSWESRALSDWHRPQVGSYRGCCQP